jgi:hypothetical protein
MMLVFFKKLKIVIKVIKISMNLIKKNHRRQIKWTKKIPIINYKKYVVNNILERKRKKNLLETHHYSVVDTTSPPKKSLPRRL